MSYGELLAQVYAALPQLKGQLQCAARGVCAVAGQGVHHV